MTRHTDHEKVQAQVYHDNASAYDEINAGKVRTCERKASMIADAIRAAFPGPVRILEVGCGTGLFTARLARRLPQASFVATDCYEPMLDFAAKRLAEYPNIELRVQDAGEALPPGLEFDVVCGVDIIHHLADPATAMRHWRNAAHPNSRICFSEGNPRNPVLYWRLRSQPQEERFYLNSRRNLTQWMTQGGWKDPRVDNMPMYLPPGPVWMSPITSGAEDLLHLGRALWGNFSGSFLVQARAG